MNTPPTPATWWRISFASIYIGAGTGHRDAQFLVLRSASGAQSPVLMFEHESNRLVPVTDSIAAFLATAIVKKRE